MPLKVRNIHVVNVPSFMDKLFAVMKPFLKKEVTDMVSLNFITSTSSLWNADGVAVIALA